MDYQMIDGEVMASEHPKTWEMPSEQDRKSLKVGDHAKIGLRIKDGPGERFWLKVTQVIQCDDGSGRVMYQGAVDNDLVVFDFPVGHILDFEPRHVLTVI